MEFLIYYVSFAILSVVSLEIPSLRTSESDLFTTGYEELSMVHNSIPFVLTNSKYNVGAIYTELVAERLNL